MNSKKKISFIIGALTPGGAERVISTLSNQLIEQYEVIIITFTKSKPFYELDNRIKVIYCEETIDTPNSFIDSLKLNYKLTKSVSKIIKQEKIDLAIGFITSANIIAIIASKLNKIPSIISERNNPMVVKVSRFWSTLRLLFYPVANKIVLQTNGVKKFYSGKIKNHKMVVIPNPISSKLELAKNENVVKEKIILTVGRLESHKCQSLILKAFNNIETKDWKLVIVGVGPREKELKDYVKENKLSDKVEFKGKVKEIDKLYNKTGIFVFASRYEGYPNVIIEAMSFGIPTISSDCDFGPTDIIKNDENGFLFPVDNQNELEKKLSLLINNEDIREKFTENSKLNTKKFQSNVVTSQWNETIKSLI